MDARQRHPAAAAGSVGRAPGRLRPDAAIIQPTLNGYIGGVVEIIGNARGGPYRLEYGSGAEPQEWIPIGPEHGGDISNGVLESFDTTGLAEGLYTLRLTVNRETGRESGPRPSLSTTRRRP